MTFVVVGTTGTGLIDGISAPGKNPNVMAQTPSATLSTNRGVAQSTRIDPPSMVDGNGRVDLPGATEDRYPEATAADPGSDQRDHVPFVDSNLLVGEDGSE